MELVRKIISLKFPVFLLITGTRFFCFGADDFTIQQEPIVFAAPASIETPLVEYKGAEWRGLFSGVKKPMNRVFEKTEDWENFWEEMIAPHQKKKNPIPAVDFSKEMLIGIFRGQQLEPVFDIEIVSIVENKTELVVQYKEINRLAGLSTPRIKVQPFHIKKLPRFSGPVRFERMK